MQSYDGKANNKSTISLYVPRFKKIVRTNNRHQGVFTQKLVITSYDY